MKFDQKYLRVDYSDLNSKQKENHNFHKVASVLADFGFNSMRLNDDWQGADFIAIHVSQDEMVKVQLKGRFSIDKKYIGKNLYIAFIENEKVKIYYHDKAIEILPENIVNSKSWKETGRYTWIQTPRHYSNIISVIND